MNDRRIEGTSYYTTTNIYRERRTVPEGYVELGNFRQDPKILGFKGPRKMTILIRALTRDGKRSDYRPVKEFEILLSKYCDGGACDLL
ncbi:hypothetical protein MFLAVUS_005439 [Mucor flavus]|uniref:Uncharacterized protein n=1 Tax=Mucor flavus TaxID=439312 RepID=A0ABP9YYP3_9FUNG